MEEEGEEVEGLGEVCAGCGRRFQCGMKVGLECCWCASLPPMRAVPVAGKGCYCPECLARRVSEAAGSAPRP